MTTIRVDKNRENPYVMIDKTTVQDKTLSWKARGILAYLLSLPDNWVVYISEMKNHAPDGEASLRSGMHELETAGYLTKSQERNDTGTFGGYNYTVHEIPTVSRKSPNGHQPYTEKPYAVNRTLLSNNNNNNILEPAKNGGQEKPSSHQEKKPPKKEPQFPDPQLEWLKKNLQPLGFAFLKEAGSACNATSKGEVSLWYKELLTWSKLAAEPGDVATVVKQMRSDGLRIKSPVSVTGCLRDHLARKVASTSRVYTAINESELY